MHKIVVSQNGTVQQVLLLEQEHYLIGRAPGNHIVLDHLEISGQHAKISLEGGHYYIVDQNSRNGTFVNGARINGSYRLKEGTEIAIGPFTLKCTSSTVVPSDTPRPENTTSSEDDADAATRTRIGDLSKIHPTLEMHKRTAYLRSASQTLGENNPRLVIVDRDHRAVTYPLREQPITIGRAANCTVRTRGWFSFFAPALLASVEWFADEVVITRRSRFGRIHCNGQPIKKIQILVDGDTLHLGGLEIKFFV